YLDNGTIILAGGGEVGTGPFTLVNGTLNVTGGGVNNPINLAGTPTIATTALTFHGTVTLLTNSTVTANIATTFDGVIADGPGGPKTLTLSGLTAITTTLNNANTYSGG